MVATPARRRRAASSWPPTTRILDADDKVLRQGRCKFTGGDKAARDHVWLKKDEWRR